MSDLYPTKLVYLTDTYKFICQAKILKTGKDDAKGNFLILDQTIFYPQSGGQPSDTGTASVDETCSLDITFAAFQGETVLHFVKQDLQDDWPGKSIVLKLDQDRRLLNAKSHTAGHLMGSIVEKLAPELVGIKGFHFPEGPNVEFTGKLTSYASDELLKKTNEIMKEEIDKQVELSVRESESGEKNNRVVFIPGYEGTPCGGTHLKNLNQLKEVAIKKIKFKSGITKISYTFQ